MAKMMKPAIERGIKKVGNALKPKESGSMSLAKVIAKQNMKASNVMHYGNMAPKA